MSTKPKNTPKLLVVASSLRSPRAPSGPLPCQWPATLKHSVAFSDL